MPDTQSQTPQPRALHHGAPQRTAAEDLLLICCKALDGSCEVTSTHPDSSSKTIGLELISATISTCERGFC